MFAGFEHVGTTHCPHGLQAAAAYKLPSVAHAVAKQVQPILSAHPNVGTIC